MVGTDPLALLFVLSLVLLLVFNLSHQSYGLTGSACRGILCFDHPSFCFAEVADRVKSPCKFSFNGQ